MVVGINVDLAGGDEDEGRIDVDGELNITVFVSVKLELRLFLS